MSKELEALEKLMNEYCDCCPHDGICGKENNNSCTAFQNYKLIETALKRNIELEQRNLLLTNLKTTSMINKKPLSSLFNGLSQEERYKYIEHIYYTYSEVKEELDCLKLEYRKVVSDSKAKDEKLKKEHKALRIIKEKRVNVQVLNYSINVSEYNKRLVYGEKYLTQEEYDLLKEVLL